MNKAAPLTSASICMRSFKVSHQLPEDNQVAFFDETHSELVVVNALGGAIWELLDGELSVRQIAEILSTEVPGAPAPHETEKAVLAFLSTLSERAAITLVGTEEPNNS